MSRAVRRWAALFLLLLASGPIPARGATVTVLDPEGRHVADALVMCLGPEEGLSSTAADGVAIVPEACASVSCALGGYLPGEALMEQGVATCRLAAGVRVSIALDQPGCADFFHVGLVPVEPAGDPVWVRELESEPDSGGCAARLRPVSPGTYDFRVTSGQGWSCRARVVLSLPDQDDDELVVLHAGWREPLQVIGTVLDAEGRPVPDIPMRVRELATGVAPLGAGEWRCESGEWRADVFTADDGTFRVLVDPTLRVVLEAGSSWDPDGFASVEVGPQQGPAGPVVLRLRESE